MRRSAPIVMPERGDRHRAKWVIAIGEIRTKTCRAGDAADKWIACGADLDGDDLDVVLVIEAGLVIVTVY